MEQEKITLTLEEEKKEEVVEEVKEEVIEGKPFNPYKDYEIELNDEERKMVDDFAKQIDITKSDVILQYGSQAQNKIASFSDTALDNVKTKDLGSIGNSLASLVSELKNFDVDEKDNKGIFDFFKKPVDQIASIKAKYDKVDVNVNKIVKILEEHQITLLKDISLLDELYEKNTTNFKELSMYIMAGYKKLEEVKTNELAKLIEISEKTGKSEDAQAANDLANACERFEKKLHDLELTRAVSVQMAPQIRLIQNNDTLMTEKIQSTLVNTIPLWKSQMVLALGVNHSKQAMEAQREVSDMTNKLLKKNAEILKTSTVEVAKESERGIVDLETLKETNLKLISTLDDVMKIQDEGRLRRREAQKELARIEEELRKKLLEIKGR